VLGPRLNSCCKLINPWSVLIDLLSGLSNDLHLCTTLAMSNGPVCLAASACAAVRTSCVIMESSGFRSSIVLSCRPQFIKSVAVGSFSPSCTDSSVHRALEYWAACVSVGLLLLWGLLIPWASHSCTDSSRIQMTAPTESLNLQLLWQVIET
jgi:hypothetical protein